MHHAWIPIYAHVVHHRWLDPAIPISKAYAQVSGAVLCEVYTGILPIRIKNSGSIASLPSWQSQNTRPWE